MRSPINRKLKSVLLSGALLLYVASCQSPFPEPAHPRAGDIVPPQRASVASSSRGISEPSLYEYSDHRPYVTTGKRIRFRIDNALLSPTDRSDGPKLSISLVYDGRTLGRWTPATPGHVVSASLESDALGGNLTPANITRAETTFGFFGLEPGDLRLRGRKCEMDAYEVAQNDYETRAVARYGRGAAGEEFRRRWGGSMLFALRNGQGPYSDVIACSQRSPTCRATTSYRGWPVRLTFPNHRICEYRQVVADARRMLDGFYLDESERSPGQTEQRWRPVTISHASA